MKFMKSRFFLFKIAINLICLQIACIGAENYFKYKVYDVNAKNEFEKEVIYQLSNNDNYDFFHLPKEIGKAARVMIQPIDQIDFESALNSFGIEYEIVSDDLGETIQSQQLKNGYFRKLGDKSNIWEFSDFHRHHQINEYLDNLAKEYPDRVIVNTVGKSHEGRDIKTITITDGDASSNKKVILVDAGIHAREWLAPATALYIIHQLVNFKANRNLLKSYDWVIMPIVNPDGYEFSQTESRMWRKTRKPVANDCFGTDANRNFDFHWGDVGASSISCSDTYKGDYAFSEPETQIVRDLMLSLQGRAKMYLTLHSYGNYLVYPWGWTSDLPETWRDIDDVARIGAEAIFSVKGTNFTVGSSTNILYAASGSSDDYAFAKAKIPISITMELQGGGTGFDPAPEQIKPFTEEAWVGIKAMAEAVITKY